MARMARNAVDPDSGFLGDQRYILEPLRLPNVPDKRELLRCGICRQLRPVWATCATNDTSMNLTPAVNKRIGW
jgi:hypothetical protein